MKSFTFQGVFILFFRDWWRTREWPAFWFGLPAVVAGLGLVSLFTFAELQSSLERSREYLMAARQSQILDKLEAADIFYKKALLENPDDLEALLEAAALADNLGTRPDVMRFWYAWSMRSGIRLGCSSRPIFYLDSRAVMRLRAKHVP